MTQIKNRFDKASLVKVLKGAGIAGGAVAITYVLESFVQMDFGQLTALVVGLCSILINTVRNWKKGKIEIVE